MRISNLLAKHRDGREKYQSVYEEFFTDEFCGTVKNILEIGIGFGAGLDGWLNVFPSATVYGIDTRSVELKSNPRLIVRVVNSAVKADVETFFDSIGGVMMDVIIDDGDHQEASQLATLKNCLPYLTSGGLYMIEDTGPRFAGDRLVMEVTQVCKNAGTLHVRPLSNLDGVIVFRKSR